MIMFGKLPPTTHPNYELLIHLPGSNSEYSIIIKINKIGAIRTRYFPPATSLSNTTSDPGFAQQILNTAF